MTGKEDPVTGQDLTRLKEGNIANEDILDIDDMFVTLSNNLDTSFLFIVVKDPELPLLLPIVERSDYHLCELLSAHKVRIVIESHIRR